MYNTFHPILKHAPKRSILKHTPGGVQHDQTEHGNWSSGPSPDEDPTTAPPQDPNLEPAYTSPFTDNGDGTSSFNFNPDTSPSLGLGGEIISVPLPSAGGGRARIHVPGTYHPLHFVHPDLDDAAFGDVVRMFPEGQTVTMGGYNYKYWIDQDGTPTFDIHSVETGGPWVQLEQTYGAYGEGENWNIALYGQGDNGRVLLADDFDTIEDDLLVSEVTSTMDTGIKYPPQPDPEAVFDPPALNDPGSYRYETLNSRRAPQDFGIYNDANEALFGGSGKNRSYTQDLHRRTEDGKGNVAYLMEWMSEGRVEGEWAAFDNRMTDHAKGFLDDKWETVTGVASIDGYTEDGTPTWREWFTPDEIEGQLALETQGTGRNIAETATGMQVAELELVPSDRGFSSAGMGNPDDWNDLHEFIERGGFGDTLEKQGLLPQGPSVNDFNAALEEDFASSIYEELDYIGMNSTADGSLIPLELSSLSSPVHPNDFDNFVTHFRSQWASSSSHPLSIAVQLSAQKQFGLNADIDHFMPEALGDGEALYGMFPETFDTYVQAMYENTQTQFREMGITHLPIVRGMALEPEDLVESLDLVENGGNIDLERFAAEVDEIASNSSSLSWQDGDKYYHSLDGRWRESSMDLQPISSFSTDIGTSSNFTHQRHGMSSNARQVMVRAMVPVERVIGHSLDGFGSLKENEVLVLGGADLPVDVFTWRYDTFASQAPGSFGSIQTVWGLDK